MEIQGIITNKVAEVSGISKTSGEPWKIASYLVNVTEPANSGTMVIDVKDGNNGRIAKLNLQNGHKYTLWLNFEAPKYNDRYFSKIVCWSAREVVLTDEDALLIAPQVEPAKTPELTPIVNEPTPVTTVHDGKIEQLPF